MSETNQNQNQGWENVGVAYLSNSGKAINLSVFGKVLVIPLKQLEKVISGGASTVSVSAPKS